MTGPQRNYQDYVDLLIIQSTSEVGLFWQACETLSDAAQPYDVLFFPDSDPRPDTLKADDLNQYRTLILPDCRYLTKAQLQVLQDYLANDGRLLVIGQLSANLSQEERVTILNHPGTRPVAVGAAFDLDWLPLHEQLTLSAPADIAINLQRVENGVAVHIIRYDYNSQQDQVPALDALNLDLRLRGNFSGVEVFSPSELPKVQLDSADGLHHLKLQDVPLYSIVLLKSISDNTN